MTELQKCLLDILLEVDRLCRENGIKYFLIGGTLLGAVRHNGFIPWDDDLDIAMDLDDYRRFLKIARKKLPDTLFLQCTYTDLWYPAFAKIRKNGTAMIEKEFKGRNFHQGVWIDVFPLVSVPEDEKKAASLNKKIRLSYILTQDAFWTKDDKPSPKLKALSLIPLSLRRFACRMIRKNALKPAQKGKYCTHCSHFRLRRRYLSEDFGETVYIGFEGHELPCPKGYDSILTAAYGDYMTPPPPDKRTAAHNIATLDLTRSYKNFI
ncbi:MAG: LicD family protein [Clostridiales bacterium]|nr:LicD family protein [Clostridiales bacterium]